MWESTTYFVPILVLGRRAQPVLRAFNIQPNPARPRRLAIGIQITHKLTDLSRRTLGASWAYDGDHNHNHNQSHGKYRPQQQQQQSIMLHLTHMETNRYHESECLHYKHYSRWYRLEYPPHQWTCTHVESRRSFRQI